MNKIKLISAIALGAAAVGLTIKDYVKIIRTEKETRRKIEVNADDTIRAMRIASARVTERIKSGYYDKRGFQAITDDFDFETIIEFNKEK